MTAKTGSVLTLCYVHALRCSLYVWLLKGLVSSVTIYLHDCLCFLCVDEFQYFPLDVKQTICPLWITVGALVV